MPRAFIHPAVALTREAERGEQLASLRTLLWLIAWPMTKRAPACYGSSTPQQRTIGIAPRRWLDKVLKAGKQRWIALGQRPRAATFTAHLAALTETCKLTPSIRRLV